MMISISPYGVYSIMMIAVSPYYVDITIFTIYGDITITIIIVITVLLIVVLP